MFLAYSCSCLWPVHTSQVLVSRLWRLVGAAPTGEAPTASEWSPILLPTNVWLLLEVWRYLYIHIFLNHWYFNLETLAHTLKVTQPIFDAKYVHSPSINLKLTDIFNQRKSIVACIMVQCFILVFYNETKKALKGLLTNNPCMEKRIWLQQSVMNNGCQALWQDEGRC